MVVDHGFFQVDHFVPENFQLLHCTGVGYVAETIFDVCLNNDEELLRSLTNVFDRVGDIECLTEFRNGIFRSNLWFLWFGAQERADVEAGKGFNLIAVAFAGLGFRWDWRRSAMITWSSFAHNVFHLS